MSRELRKRCQRIVDGLGLPQPFSLELFLGQLEKRRGRRIRTLPIPPRLAPSAPCGLWIETKDIDFIFYDAGTTPFHQRFIIAHECAHLVCADQESSMSAGSLDLRQILPHLDPSLIQRVLGRDGYTDAEEEEAEMIASLIMDHDIKTAGAKPGAMGRLESVLGSRSHRPLKQ
ncbi:ImmA/IrrE family metallo-endopeptidase [Actinoplanes sp. NPDC026619]|uniref:ImmA/IrrE family metallo-endopeptidase n=1 Tax=Actinoplanes sp. NPDC026619 TaxID=3155798 RepID=UPI0033C28196